MKLTKIVLALGLALSLCAPAAADGPRCTVTYPRGFKLPQDRTVKVKNGKETKKIRLPVICKNGDLEATWGKCQLRYRT